MTGEQESMSDKLFEYVKHGPNAGTTIPEIVLGLCLHYMLWLMVLTLLLVWMLAGLIATFNYPEHDLVMFGVALGWLAAMMFSYVEDSI